MQKLFVVEYIWLDGINPVNKLRSKSRVILLPDNPKIKDFPYWSFDGSSTGQASTTNSDCILVPVNAVLDPLPNNGDYLVLCEVLNPDGTMHLLNNRAKLRSLLEQGGNNYNIWVGFEQEYTMFKNNIPLGWPKEGYPDKQGQYYCGVGVNRALGRELANRHREFCIKAGLVYYGMNAEVMPSQWEFQIGYRGKIEEDVSALNMSDHLWFARWLIERIGEEFKIEISFDNKPVKGDWNGAGMHTNFSTKDMRDPIKGSKFIKSAINNLSLAHKQHIRYYGHKLEERLTGLHETSEIDNFSVGEANRRSSIRIPKITAKQGYGYIEDRRPGANADPYLVSAILISTICKINFYN